MPEFTAFVGKLAGIISLIAFVPYIVAILRRQTKPNRATWWIWTAVGLMLGSSYYFSGASHTIWVPVSYTVGPFITALLSIKYGEGGWTRFDRWCLIGAGVSLLLWVVFREPLVALTINLIIDLLGALPTIRKAYRKPEEEDRLAWLLFFLGNTCNMFAVEQWNYAIAAYPIYMFLVCGTIALLVLRPRSKKR
ncbi:hypothetical protein KJ910_03780 [Patescibacteria group bacterium]|nr:hypothetical protein [Patescibacteria group bacterium]MBU1906968.1 hypothetical protein [Patescibacteria group bacterium]